MATDPSNARCSASDVWTEGALESTTTRPDLRRGPGLGRRLWRQVAPMPGQVCETCVAAFFAPATRKRHSNGSKQNFEGSRSGLASTPCTLADVRCGTHSRRFSNLLAMPTHLRRRTHRQHRAASHRMTGNEGPLKRSEAHTKLIVPA